MNSLTFSAAKNFGVFKSLLTHMNSRPTAFLFLLLLLSSPLCFAGGSIDWDEVRARIKKEDPFLADYIAAHFTVNRVGGAVRVGHDRNGNSMVEGEEIGARLPPYNFYAKPKEEKGDYTLYMTLEPADSKDPKITAWQITIRQKLITD